MDSDKASYKQKLDVLQQQEELIEDEEEQEMKEEELRRSKREAEEQRKREEEARMAQSLLPESEVNFFGVQVNAVEELTGPVLPLL